MATTIRLDAFTAKASPVPADIVYLGDSANAFQEVQSTIAEVIGAYPALSSIGGLTTAANEIIYTTASNTYATAPVTAFSLSVLALSAATTTPTASVFAGWDANKNLSANNFLSGFQTIATAAGSTTLTVASPYITQFTGSTTQTCVMPVVSTLVLGQAYLLVNNSSGAITVNSSGGNLIQTMAANTSLLLYAGLITGTTAASWQVVNYSTSDTSYPLSVALGGTGVSSVTVSPAATAWAGWDANKNLSANNVIQSFTTIASAGGTTTLTVASTAIQQITGSTTQTIVMPVVSTLVAGQMFILINNSTGNVTVNSSGGNLIVTMAAGTTAFLTCVLNTGTTAASWNSSYFYDNGAGVVSITGTANQIAASSATGAVTLSLAGGYGGLKSFQIFTSGTAQTYTKPAGVTNILVEVLGGGGGGGGAAGAASSLGAGAGGGAGGYARLYVAGASSTYTYTVGGGGAGGTAGNNAGTAGGTTTFSASSLQATGGAGGTGSPANTSNQAVVGVAGGVGSNGNFNCNGAPGQPGVTFGSVVNNGVPGHGGSSLYGAGGFPPIAANSPGNAAAVYGGGGSGAYAFTSSQAGGNGAGGLIVAWEFG
jgi:hypothetical protein